NPEQIGKGDSDALQKMQSLIGLEQAKAQLNKFISTARINAEQSRRGIKQTASFANHMVFAGPAGTGKTTVANYLAQALADEGVLRDNKVVVVGSKDLVSKWVGDTKDKTHNVILSALG
ncbi:AAA family ATPase, partial [Staphylococcus aureus]|uniref:AAA family ATPase n=1 Tax=Staphylococcus aureus TaxID=1280 RepID=UPI000BD2CC32